MVVARKQALTQDARGADALPGRRERGKREKRERLVSAARELFAKKGFTATTTLEIAERADVGAGTLFLYVQSKEELLVLVFQEDMGRVRDEAFATLPKRATLLDEIFHVYRAMTEFHERDRALARVYVKEMAFVREPNRHVLRGFMEGIYARIEQRIDAAKVRGEVAADVSSRALARNLFGLFFMTLQVGLGEDVSLTSADHLALLRESLALQLRGLAATSHPRSRRSGAARSRGARK